MTLGSDPQSPDTPGPEQGPEAVWNPDYNAEWAEAVAGWKWEEWQEGTGPREGWVKSGACPRCTHPMSVFQREMSYIIEPAPWVDAGCNCGETHEKRPDDARFPGCGPKAQVKRHGGA